jgi:hypothetical protein
MKKFTTLALLLAGLTVFLGSCVRNNDSYFDESYWLSRERGEVVYSDAYCNYYVVETFNGYTVVRTYGGYKPFEGSIVYGNFSASGTRDFYNRSTGVIYTGVVTDYWLSYNEAQDALDYYCPIYGGKGKREFKKATTLTR